MLNPGTEEAQIMRSKGLDTLKAGDLISLRLPGAGGYGDPGERDRAALLRDVRDGKVSLEAAAEAYQVEVTEEDLAGLEAGETAEGGAP